MSPEFYVLTHMVTASRSTIAMLRMKIRKSKTYSDIRLFLEAGRADKSELASPTCKASVHSKLQPYVQRQR